MGRRTSCPWQVISAQECDTRLLSADDHWFKIKNPEAAVRRPDRRSDLGVRRKPLPMSTRVSRVEDSQRKFSLSPTTRKLGRLPGLPSVHDTLDQIGLKVPT